MLWFVGFRIFHQNSAHPTSDLDLDLNEYYSTLLGHRYNRTAVGVSRAVAVALWCWYVLIFRCAALKAHVEGASECASFVVGARSQPRYR